MQTKPKPLERTSSRDRAFINPNCFKSIRGSLVPTIEGVEHTSLTNRRPKQEMRRNEMSRQFSMKGKYSTSFWRHLKIIFVYFIVL